MRRIVHLLAIGTLAAAAPATAATFVFGGTLSGSNEVPPNNSPGTGYAMVTVDDVALTLRVQATFSGLTTGTAASHLHISPPGTNGPVVTTVPSFPGFPLGVTAGTFDRTFDLTAASTYNPAFLNNATNGGSTLAAARTLLAAHQAGNAYFNIHSMQFPGGEIRANLAAVPEPASWAMMIGGFALVGVALRGRRRVSAV